MVPSYIFDEDEFMRVESPVSTLPFFAEGFVHLVDATDPIMICRDFRTFKIPYQMFTRHKLEMGDLVAGQVAFKTGISMDNAEKGRFIVTEVQKVNGVSVHSKSEVRPVSFEKLDGVSPYAKATLEDEDIRLGSRIMIDLGEKSDKIEPMANIKITGDKIIRIALIIDECDYCVKHLTRAGFSHVFLVTPDSGLKTQISTVLYALFFAKKEAATGKNVIFFIDSLSKLVRMFDKLNYKTKCGELEVTKVFIGSIQDVKKIYLGSKQLDNGGSLTNIAFTHKPRTRTEEYVLEDISELVNQVIPFPASQHETQISRPKTGSVKKSK